MRRAYTFAPWLLAAGLLAAGSGCGGGDDLPRERISGTVTLDGEPLSSATITFQPVDPTGPPTGVEATVSGGSFSVPVSQGLVPGPYRVNVSKLEPDSGPAPKRKANRNYEDTSGTGADDAPPDERFRETIPEKYNARSTLKADVSKGGPNEFTFELSSK